MHCSALADGSLPDLAATLNSYVNAARAAGCQPAARVTGDQLVGRRLLWKAPRETSPCPRLSTRTCGRARIYLRFGKTQRTQRQEPPPGGLAGQRDNARQHASRCASPLTKCQGFRNFAPRSTDHDHKPLNYSAGPRAKKCPCCRACRSAQSRSPAVRTCLCGGLGSTSASTPQQQRTAAEQKASDPREAPQGRAGSPAWIPTPSGERGYGR